MSRDDCLFDQNRLQTFSIKIPKLAFAPIIIAKIGVKGSLSSFVIVFSIEKGD